MAEKKRKPVLPGRRAGKESDWRGRMFADIRRIIHDADPEMVEEWKYMGTPVFSHNGSVCLVNTFKNKVKVTFHDGASLEDPHRLFNADLRGGKWRSIDIFEGDAIDERSFKNLILIAVSHNLGRARPAKARRKAASA